MKRLLLILVFVFAASYTALPVGAQVKSDKFDKEKEMQEVEELAERFIKRLDEAGDIEPLIKEMFVDDFMGRYVKEQKAGEFSRLGFNMSFVVDSSLLETANDDDWRRFYVSTFNLSRNLWVALLNERGDRGAKNGYNFDDNDADESVTKLFPASFWKILNANPKLKALQTNEFQEADIETIDEFRHAALALNDANKELRFVLGKGSLSLSENGGKALEAFTKHVKRKRVDVSDPEVCEKSCFGFPKGTKMIDVVIFPYLYLKVTKLYGHYTIVWAEYVDTE